MAMAVVWSEKLERSKCADVSEFDEKFWENWARSVDLSCMVGGRQVVDERGRHFPCGIGCADVHGLKGHRYNKAVKAAEDRALQNLSFEMFADVATVEFLSERSDEMDADGDSNERFASSFCARVEAKCQKRRVRAKKVHGAVVKNPVSGRDMFVCVLAALEKEKKENE